MAQVMLDPPRRLIDVEVDGAVVRVPEGSTLLDACRAHGVDTPTLCYADNLTPVNACRVCVVEVEGSRVLVPACSRQAGVGYEDVDIARRGREALGGARLREVGRQGSVAVARQLGHQLLQRLRAARAQRDTRPARGEGCGNHTPQASRCTGEEGCTTGEIHRFPKLPARRLTAPPGGRPVQPASLGGPGQESKYSARRLTQMFASCEHRAGRSSTLLAVPNNRNAESRHAWRRSGNGGTTFSGLTRSAERGRRLLQRQPDS